MNDFILVFKAFYYFELVLAELVFLQAYPRKKHFLLKFILGMVVSFALFLGITIVMDAWDNAVTSPIGTMLIQFLRLLLIISVSVGYFRICFSGKFGVFFSACIGGVAIQQIGYQISVLFCLPFTSPVEHFGVYMESVFCILTDIFMILTLGRSLRKNQYYKNYDNSLIGVSIVTILICIGIIRLTRVGTKPDNYISICLSVYSITCCSLVLFIQFALYRFIRLRSENGVLRRIGSEEKKQYELSRMNNNLLNIKCHDLKHTLAYMKEGIPNSEAQEMENLIKEYDSFVNTGLEPLNVIINEKNHICLQKGIVFTFIGDGKYLSFMNVVDIYSLFGNAIENAIEATEQISDPEKKAISVILEQKGNMTYINFLNYYQKDILMQENNMPLTTKKSETGYHGFGVASIAGIATKYGGNIMISTENNLFSLNIYLTSEAK